MIMATKQDVRARAPRGTKIVAQAFFAALGDVADGQQPAVASAALIAIRDALKVRREKIKKVAAKARAKLPGKTKAAAKPKAVPAKRAKAAVPAAKAKRAVVKKAPAKAKLPKAVKAKAPRKIAPAAAE